jgi:Peptidase family S41
VCMPTPSTHQSVRDPDVARPLHRARLAAVVTAMLLVALAPPRLATQPSRPSLPCDCPAILARTVTAIETDYVAFPLEVRDARAIAWRAHVDSLRPRADGADASACSALLRRLVRFFHDGHLLIIDRPVADSTGLAARRDARPRRGIAASDPWNERAVRDSLSARGARGIALAPVEGIWRGPGYRIAVLADDDARDRATGVVIAVDSGPWQPGQVRAEFVRVDGEWVATVWDDAFVPRTSPVELSRGALLRMAPMLWGRVDPAEALAFVDTLDPRRPLVAFPDDSTAVISVVTFDPAYGGTLAATIDREWDRLRERSRVVIDLRGNEGGSSGQVLPLLPFLWGDGAQSSQEDAPKPTDALVRSSPAMIAVWERMGWAPKGLVDRMRARPGELVPFDPTEREQSPRRPRKRPRDDQQVYLLTDGATVSAAEQVVLWARRLGRATIVGAPTGGSIDYQSTFLSRVACPSMGQTLVMPLIATSGRLPEGGHNATGVVPDRRMPTTGAWLAELVRR